MSNSDTTRRRLLQGVAGTSAIAIAGCTGDDGEGNGDDGEGNGDENGMENGDENGMENGDENGMENGENMMEPTDPAEAPVVEVDRFSAEAGTLFVRENNADLPGPDEPIDFDQGPFVTTGLDPDGNTVQYYNFDVMPTAPAPIYAFFHENGDPVEDQLNIIDVVPGDEGYNDFWHVHKVTVPDDYHANTITNAADLFEAKSGGMPTSPIHVTFNVNAGEEGGGPPSGFVTEEGSAQTHNVVATVPGDPAYSPLWDVKIYDNADFDSVSDLDSALDAEQLADGPTVNCPIVSEA